MCPIYRIVAGIAGVLSVVVACPVYVQGQESSGTAVVAEPQTLDAAIRVMYPPTLADAERFSAELGVIAPQESARAIRERLNSCVVEPVCAPSALGGSLPEVVLGAVRFTAPAGLSPGLREWLDRPGRAAAVVCAVQFNRNPTAEEVARMLDLGVVPHFSAGNLVSVIEVPADAVEPLAALPLVHWMGLFTEEHKVSNRDRAAVIGRGADAMVSFYVWPLAKADAGRADALNSLGANAVRYDPVANVYVVEASGGALLSAARLNWVRQVELAKHAGTHDGPGLGYSPADSRELVSAPQAHFAYDGSGVRVGVLDTGIWADHDDFGGAIAWQYDQATGQSVAPDTDGHGTRVAGVIAGRGVRLSAARGVAPGASLYVVKGQAVDLGSNIWGYDPVDAFDRFLSQEVFVVNNSWGTRLDQTPEAAWNFGYDSTAALADAYADNESLTLIFSAGNEGDGGGTVTEPGVGKNVITVGAVSYTNGGGSGDVGRVPCYSSRGPTADDGRLKPDVVAPGGDAAEYTGDCVWSDHDYGVVTCNAQTNGVWLDGVNQRWGSDPPESFYTRQAGTSMAAPHVTGIAAMLYQAYEYEFPYDDGLVPRDIKALLVANAIPVHDYGTNPVNGYANTDTGYGLVDAYHTLLDVPLEKRMLLWAHGGVVETTANSQEWSFYPTGDVRRLVVVMCYEDDEGEEHDGDALKDDLDLTLTAPDGTEFSFTLPAGVATESPLEKIVVNSPSIFGTGEWTATVSGSEWNELLDPFEFQRYTIIATAYYVDPYSPSISLETPVTIDVEPGDVFSVGATITNLNGLTAGGITVELIADAVFGEEASVTKLVGNIIGKGSRRQIEFTGIVAPEVGGTHGLTLRASGVNRGLADVVQQIQVRVAGSAPSGSCPQVVATWPPHGGPMVTPATDIRIRFSGAMDSSSLDGSTIQVEGTGSGWHDGAFSYDGADYTLTFTPYVDFALGETVSVTVSGDVMSDDGVSMASDHLFIFETIATTPTPIGVGGALTEDTTWTSGNVYLVTSDLTIPVGVTLTIEAGVVVKFNAVDTNTGSSSHRHRNDLIVTGTLALQSTFGQKVVFTSSRDDMYGGDSNGDGAGSGPGSENWGAIKYTNPDNVLHDAVIRYGGVGYSYYSTRYNTQMVWVAGSGGATLEIRDCVIENTYDKAIYAESARTPWVHDNTISGASQGIVGTVVTVEDNGISGTGSYAVNLSGIATVEGNTISGGGTGIRVSGGNIQNNSISGGSGWGIYLTGTGGSTVSGNTITDKDYPVYQGPGDAIYTDNVFGNNVNTVIGVGGAVNQDVTWDDVQGLGYPYLVISDVTVSAGQTLTIDPGVVVKFNAVDTNTGSSSYRYRHDLIVAGTLDLQSTPGQEVVFTSSRDDEYGGDSNGDGATSGPGSENWGAIKYTNPDNVLHDAVIRYGGVSHSYYSNRYNTQMVWVAGSGGATLEIRDCVLENTYDKAIYAESAQTPWVHDNTISGCPQGIVGTVITVEDNNISSAGSYAINLSGVAIVEGNTISDGGMAIRVSGGSIQDNSINGGSSWGIYLTGAGDATINGNTVTDKDYPVYQGAGDPVYSGNVFSNNTNTVIGVGGTISQDVIWDDVQGLGYPYLVTSDVTVSAGATLTIDPGIVVKFNAVDTNSGSSSYYYRNDLIVTGTLDLQSTPGQEVVFTSSRDDEYGGDSNGDGAASGPGSENWGAIKYTNPDNVLHDAVIRYGGVGSSRYGTRYDTQMVWVAGSGSATLEIRDCVMENTYTRAIYAESTQTPWVHDNTISGSPQAIVGTTATIENNHISGAGSYGINFSGSCTVEWNTIIGGGTAIRVAGGSIQYNTITGGSGWGIYLTGTGTTMVIGNTVTDKDYSIYQGPGDPVYSDNVFSGITNMVIAVGGAIGQDVLWDDVPGVPYLVTSDLTIPAGVTLTIEPGVVVKFNAVDTNSGSSSYYYRNDLIVAGTLDLQSTPGQEVVFTSSRDDEYGGDSNGDGAGSSPGPENWGAIKYTNPDNVLHDAVIRYGGVSYSRYGSRYDTQMVWVAGSGSATFEIHDCVLENTYDKAIYAESALTPWVHDNTISGSPQGIVGTVATVEDNNISDAGSYAINLSGIATVEGNTITGGGTGIRVSGGSIQDNTIGVGSGWGIYLTGTGSATISGNTVTGKDYPIYQGPGDPVYSGNLFSGNTNTVIGVGGAISQDVLWEDVEGLGYPYLVTSDVTVSTGQTLTIDPGVVVKFNAVNTNSGSSSYYYRHDLIVAGTLDLQSTPGQEVVFTSSRDDEYGGDSNGDGAASGPGSENWGAIKYTNPDNVLHNAVIRYGGVGYSRYGTRYDTQMVWVAGSGSATLEIRDCVLGNTYDKAIYAESAQAPWVHDNTISGSPQGIVGTVVTVEGNEISGAGSYAINLSGICTVDGNTISEGGTGIRVSGGTIRDNTINGGSGWGIYLTGSSATTISGNTITNKDYPLYQGPGDPVYSSNLFSGNTNTVIGVGGTIGQDVTWDDVHGLGYPYLVTSDVTIPVGETLTIEAGVVVKFNAVDTSSGSSSYRYRHDLIVQGTLSPQGTPGSPVVFTSSRDDAYGGDTNGDGGGSSPARGNWGAIQFTNRNNVLHDAVIRYGGVGYSRYGSHYDTRMVWVTNDVLVTIRNCVIEEAYDNAVYLATGADTPTMIRDNWITSCPKGVLAAGSSDAVILFCTFADCTNAGVRVEGSALVDVHKCNLLTSNNYGIYNAGSVTVDGTHNWWGDASGPSGEGVGGGCAVSASVNYDPWESAVVPPGAESPTITSTPNLAAQFGLAYEYDGDGCASAAGTGTRVWSKRRGPAEFQIDSATGCISWTPAAPGPVVISIEVADDVSIDVQSFQVLVTGAGGDPDAPRVVSFSCTDLGGEEGIWNAELTTVFTENVQVSWIDVAILDSGDSVVLFDSLAYHLPTYTLTILANDLNEGEAYRLVLADTITDDARNPLDGEFDGYTFPSGDGLGGGDFVAGFSKTILRSGDLDGDGDVDLYDYAGFALCLAGPEVDAPGDGCTQDQFGMADMNGDGDVDLFDVAMFQEYFTGAK